jgi:glycosyltransferase involved in cell wall biosynthesis
MPKVSVIVPVYNHEKYIAECVESVLNQTYRDFEVVVVDDGSTDRTSEILKRFKDKIRYIWQVNKGGAAALNTAIKNSKGEYIAWVSSDDIFMPAKLEEQIRYFDSNPDVDLTYTDFYIIDGKGEIKQEICSPYYEDKRTFIYNLLIGNFINGSSVMFKRNCIDKVGYFDEEMKYHADGNMWFRMLKHFKFGHIPKLLLKYRWHESNLSHHSKNMKRFLYLHYEKVFKIYSADELFPFSTHLGSAYFNIAKILLERHGLYSLAFSKLLEGFGSRPWNVQCLKAIIVFLAIIPQRIFIDFRRRILP